MLKFRQKIFALKALLLLKPARKIKRLSIVRFVTAKMTSYKDDAAEKITSYKDDAKEKTASYKEDAKAKASSYKDDAKAKAGSYKDNVKEKANSYKDDVKQKMSSDKNDVKAKTASYKEDILQKAKDVYAKTKHSFGPLERTLDVMENSASGMLDYTAPIYEKYFSPAADRVLYTANKGMDRSKEIANTSGTISLGLLVVAIQMGALIGTRSVRLFLDALNNTKVRSENALTSAIHAEKYVEQRIRNAIDYTSEHVKNPSAKMNEHANHFLDMANSVFNRLLALPREEENPESSLAERIKYLTTRVARSVRDTTNRQVVEPCQTQLSAIIEQLQKSMVVIDFLKEKQEWTFQKMDDFSASVNEFRFKIESEAKGLFMKPEEVLIRYVHESSSALIQHTNDMRSSGKQVLSDNMQKVLNDAGDYIMNFSLNLQHATDLYSANGEVIEEVKKKIADLSQWYNQKAEQ